MSYGLQAFIFAVRNEKSLVFEVLFQSFIAVACCTCPLAERLILHSRPCDVPTAKKLQSASPYIHGLSHEQFANQLKYQDGFWIIFMSYHKNATRLQK